MHGLKEFDSEPGFKAWAINYDTVLLVFHFYS